MMRDAGNKALKKQNNFKTISQDGSVQLFTTWEQQTKSQIVKIPFLVRPTAMDVTLHTEGPKHCERVT